MAGSWSDVDYNDLAGEAFIKAIRGKVMTCHQNKLQVMSRHLGFKADYVGFGRVGVDEVITKGGIVTWGEGFTVIWANEFWDDRSLPVKKIPIHELDSEQRLVYDQKLALAQRWVIHPKNWKS